MIENFKELGFTACAIALGCSNLATFILIAVNGRTFIFENWWWLLAIEITLNIGYLAWGLERLIMDCKKIREEDRK